MPLLQMKGVRKVYQTGSERLSVLDDLDLTVEEGTTTVITGESGSGKSTLLNLIGGLDAPDDGVVECAGYNVGALSEGELTEFRNRVVGLIFQFHYLLDDFTALENVLLPAYMAGVSRAAATERARALLEEVNLTHRADHYPVQLSGGERQRAAVARALVNDPAIILADEPTGNLDEANSRIVEEILFSLVGEHRKTLLLVTHDHVLAESGDVRYHLEGGELHRR